MRSIRFALAVVLALVAGRCFAQQGPAGQGPQRQPSAEQAAEQQIQEAQRLVREGQQGRGGQGPGQGRGAQVQQEPPDDPDVDAYVNTNDFFSVSVPCKFSSKDITWATEYDSTVPGRVYNCKSGDTEYEMSVINYTDILKIRAAQKHTDAAQGDVYGRVDLAASVAYAATKLRNEAAKVTYDAFHYINLIPGHELQYKLPGGMLVYAAFYLDEDRL